MSLRSSASPPAPSIDALGHGAGDKRIEILRGIAATGSISRAAREAGISYKAAWQAIDTLTNLAGVALVERAVGGAGGGGARLTAQGTRLLALAGALDAARREVHAQWLSADGAALPRVALRTSMRNQLPATVERLDVAGRIARAILRFDGRPEGGPAVAARLTAESAELLGLRPGLPVIALCKATAVRFERSPPAARRTAGSAPGPHAPTDAVDRLEGTVAGITRDEGGDELVVTLAGGLRLVGFAAAGTALRTRQRVRAAVDASAWVVALTG